MKETILAYLIVAAFHAFWLTLAAVFLLNEFVMPFLRKKALRKAKESGHVVEASWIDSLYARGDDTSTWVLGVYEYTVNGRKYKYKGRFYPDCPLQITLFYKRNPRKAKTKLDFGFVESWETVFLVMLVVSVIAMIITKSINPFLPALERIFERFGIFQ